MPTRREIDAARREEVRVILRALDQAGNPLPFLDDAADIVVDGPARVIGPARRSFRGGQTGLWLRATGARGTIRLAVTAARLPPAEIEIAAR